MSGVAKAVGIAFAAVVAPMALPALAAAAPAAATVFSAGAAAGGGSIITSTLLSAGKSAIVGGLISKATGGKFSDGAKMGAIAGAGASLMGGFGKAMGASVPGGVEPVVSTMSAPSAAAAGGAASTGFGASITAPAAAAAPAAGGGFGQFLLGGENPLLGQVIKGAAEGYLAKASADDERAYEMRRDRDLRDSYEGSGAAMRYDEPLPRTRFDSMAARQPAYQYNRETRRIERV